MSTQPGTFDTAWSWVRRQRLLVDGFWAVFWSVVALVWEQAVPAEDLQRTISTALIPALAIGLALHRLQPRLSLSILAVMLVIHILTMGMPTMVAIIGALAAAYTCHSMLARRGRWIVTGLIFAGCAWAALDFSPPFVNLPWDERGRVIAVEWFAVTFFCLLGTLTRKRREELASAVQLAATLKAQQEQKIRLAMMDERAHIARELHDIVAHSLGVIIAQADGGRYAGANHPDVALEALAEIGSVGRTSLSEMRALLEVLRTDDPRGRQPAPRLDELTALIEEFVDAGLQVRLVESGERPEPPATVQTTIYRTVQESLTNALKHSGPGGVRVTLEWKPDALLLEVTNPLPDKDSPRLAGLSGGHGLLGMSERVGAVGGEVRYGPEQTQWQVRARIPLDKESR